MSPGYRNNHYVPEWYQKRFIPPLQPNRELYYLDLKPRIVTDSKGVAHTVNPLHRWGPRRCFSEQDLYTRRLGLGESTEIERVFFGSIDRKGQEGVEYFAQFAHPSVNYDAFMGLMRYMSTQRLRTPKGLSWLKSVIREQTHDMLLKRMLELQQLHCAIWTECVWLIADATLSATKFIISDHPVSVYNRRCGPRSMWCREYNDPDISFHGTHTIFPLSLDKILILTNKSWARNPYQSEVATRPNPNPWRQAVFSFLDIQTLRHLKEHEVQEVNFIIKSRAHRYVAAGMEEWLYPEHYVSKSNWNAFGNGYLLMPDPRSVVSGGDVMIGYQGGGGTAFDSYGRRPWEADYGIESKADNEFRSLHRFQGEFARLYGPVRRGRSFTFTKLDDEQDDEEFHKYHLGLERKFKG